MHGSSSLRWLAMIASVLAVNSAEAQWAKNVGSASFSDEGHCIATDASGNVYVGGQFQGTVDFDPGAGTTDRVSSGSFDLFFAKYNSSGDLTWARSFGAASSDDDCKGIAVDASGNVYVAGSYGGTVDFDPGAGTANLTSNGSYDVYFAKYNSSGDLVWAKSVGGTSVEVGYGLAIDGSGNVYISGRSTGSGDFDPDAGTVTLTGSGAFFAKYNSSGAIQWAKKIGASNGNSIAVDGSGNVHVTGDFTGTIDFDPGAGTSNLISSANDIFVAKYNASGDYSWAVGIGGPGDDAGRKLALDGSGNIYVVGHFEGTADLDPSPNDDAHTSFGQWDAFYMKFDQSSNWQWAFSFGGANPDDAMDVVVDGSGNLYITGYFSGTVDFNPGGTTNLTGSGSSPYFAKYDTDGFLSWVKSIETGTGYGIARDGSGNVYVCGTFAGTVDFDPDAGTTNLTSVGSYDIYFAKYSSTGALPVQMTSMTAQVSGLHAELIWSTASETNNYGFEIERREMNSQFRKVGFVAGSGTSTSPKQYAFVDRDAGAGRYVYRIKQIDNDGTSANAGEIEVEIGSAANRLDLIQNYPNPFNPSTTITFSVPEDGHTTLKVIDVLGREVATLVDGSVKAGYLQKATFDASRLPSGLYFSRLESGGRRTVRSMMLVK